MPGTTYKLIFDASQQAYQWWIPGIGVGFLLLGVILFGVLRRSSKSPLVVAFSVLWLSLASCFTVTAFVVTYAGYNQAQDVLRNGKASVVEGPVENFHPMSAFGHGDENFTVNAVPFELSVSDSSLGFNRDSAHGGPIKEGIYVRITYAHIFGDALDPTILKLEIRQ